MSRVWWHTPGRAVAATVAATVTVVVAVTGCAASAKVQTGPAAGPTSPAATAAATTPPWRRLRRRARRRPRRRSRQRLRRRPRRRSRQWPQRRHPRRRRPRLRPSRPRPVTRTERLCPPPLRRRPAARRSSTTRQETPGRCSVPTARTIRRRLRYFTTLHLKIMGLPATASQAQAASAICTDLRTPRAAPSTPPTCSPLPGSTGFSPASRRCTATCRACARSSDASGRRKREWSDATIARRIVPMRTAA